MTGERAVATKTRETALALYEAAARGAAAIAGRMAPDGALGEHLLDCYKAPWGLASAGRVREANRLLDWIAQHAMTGPGQFHFGDEPPELQRSSTYRSAWIMLGAQALGRWDIVSRAAEAAFLDHQSSTGAFHSDQAKSAIWPFNMNHTAFGGVWCLYRGQFQAARAAADAVVRHLRQQPDLDTRYVIPWTSDGCLPEQPGPDQVITYDRPDGLFFYWGTPAAFLAQAALYLGDPAYLNAAATLERLVLRLPGGHDGWAFRGKLAWGAAWLYRATRESTWADLASRIARGCLLDTQRPDGLWDGVDVRLGDGLRPYVEPSLAMSAEFTVLCVQAAGCLQA